jgi:glutamate synthase (NADPH/NADH) small chain
MGDPRGFLKVERAKEKEAPAAERVAHYREFTAPVSEEQLKSQASRCMDCGVPFCHKGCPLGNLIPEWNDYVYRGRMDDAANALEQTNNFPEVTGRVCPAPCEGSCTLNIDNNPVSIKLVEKNIAEYVDKRGYVPRIAAQKTGKRVAVIGSGPAGLAAAQQLAREGHAVVLFEKADRVGGLLRYGIPDFKLEKSVIDRRVKQLEAEGVELRTGVNVGEDVTAEELRKQFDAIVITVGARAPRLLPVPGAELAGVFPAMHFLEQSNRRVAGDAIAEGEAILATGKHVVVIGGGDTGSDCVGTSIRQGARSVTQIELMPKPSLVRRPENPWPEWPQVLRTSSSQEEGCERDWAVMTKELVGDGGVVKHLRAQRIEMAGGQMRPIDGQTVDLPADLVLLAMGFTGPEKLRLVSDLGLALDARGNIASDGRGATNVPGVFAAGDCNRGQSLVVWAIADGRRVAAGVHAFLSGAGASQAAE